MLELCDSIRAAYDSLSLNVKIFKKNRCMAEIDILAKKGSSYDIFEVKCSYRITKARKQKKKFLKHAKLKIRNIYFYCGANSDLIPL
ncbi:MAG: hypothetical protein KKF44_01265 [Nanoarchaeota archaeon]|nr:hypothetical protein [Nanoarchaeota archaeon]